MRMASATCLSTTRAISALDASPVPRFPLIRIIRDLGGGAERSLNAAFTLFRRGRANELLARLPHSCRCRSDRYWWEQLDHSGSGLDRRVNGLGRGVYG